MTQETATAEIKIGQPVAISTFSGWCHKYSFGYQVVRVTKTGQADLIDNTLSIVKYDAKFAKVYLAEKRLLLDVLREGDATLWNQANKMVKQYLIQTGA